jgi:protein-S-isoprenylcysteine O-methyltransferase Ste14
VRCVVQLTEDTLRDLEDIHKASREIKCMNLELKIPPPLVLVLVGCGMWAVAKVGPLVSVPAGAVVGVLLMIAGLALNITGVMTVGKAKTTFNPLRPETTTALVSTGVFAVSRNPMYLGMLIALLGWAVFLAAPAALIGPVVFVLYINRFQIVPEERALSSLFGAGFAEYKSKVRRWI